MMKMSVEQVAELLAGESEALPETCPVPICPPQLPHDLLGSNSVRHCEKSTTNRLSYGTAFKIPIAGSSTLNR
jgi:hypothetical protein